MEARNVELIAIRVPRMLLRRPSFEGLLLWICRTRTYVRTTLTSEIYGVVREHTNSTRRNGRFMGPTASSFDVTRSAIEKARRHVLREVVAEGASSWILDRSHRLL